MFRLARACHPMWGAVAPLLAALLLAACAGEKVEPVGPSPPERSRSILSGVDTEEIVRTRARVAALRARVPAGSLYHVAKAEAWLDFAADAGRDEASVETAEAALAEAARLVRDLDRGETPLFRTLHVIASQRVRIDLWGLVAGIKDSAGFPCAGEPLARAEVALVWAGHKVFMGEHKGAGEMEARAEWFLDAARGEFRRCIATPPARAAVATPFVQPPPAAIPAPASPPPPARRPAAAPPRHAPPAAAASGHVEIVQLRTDALFSFGAAALDAGRVESLRDLAQRIRAVPNVVAVRVQGHSDRLSRSGPALNRGLSESRARAVRDSLVLHGVDAALIDTSGHGDAKPLVDCPGPRNEALIACLAPNRRVDVEIERAH